MIVKLSVGCALSIRRLNSPLAASRSQPSAIVGRQDWMPGREHGSAEHQLQPAEGAIVIGIEPVGLVMGFLCGSPKIVGQLSRREIISILC